MSVLLARLLVARAPRRVLAERVMKAAARPGDRLTDLTDRRSRLILMHNDFYYYYYYYYLVTWSLGHTYAQPLDGQRLRRYRPTPSPS